MFSTLFQKNKMTENINKLIFSELIFELLHKNKNLKKIKLSMFCKTRLCVIKKKI